MKKLILVSIVAISLLAIGLVQAKNQMKVNGVEIKPNIANVLQADLKQRIQIDETASGNMAWLTGAKIIEISGASTSTPNLIKVNVFGQDYKIDITNSTNVVRQYWGKSAMDLSEFSVGDIINVYGTLDSSDYFLIHAKTVRNVSIQKLHAVFTGNILSIDSSNNSFVMEVKRTSTTTLTVNTDANTKIYSGSSTAAFSDFKTGMKVMVRGIWDRTLTKIQALLIRMKPFEAEKSD